MSSYVIYFANLSLFKYHINGYTMVFHIEPVPYVDTLAIYGQFLIVLSIVYHKRYQLLRELIGAVVVGAS